MARARLQICSVVMILMAVGLARAESATAADKAVAESLFQDGRRLMASGDLEQACAKLAESHRLVPRLGTLLNVATCHERQGKTASAWAEFTEAAALAKRDRRRDRENYARDHAAALEKKLSRVVFELTAPAEGIVLRLDGKPIGSAAWGAPFPVDPGPRAIEVSAPGRQSWARSIEVAPGPVTVRVEVPELEPKTAALAADPETGPAESHAAQPAPVADPGSSGSAQRTLGWVVLGAGAVGLGVGGYFGLETFSKQNQSEDHCTGTACDQTGVDLREQAKMTATISTIAFAAGAVGLGAGIILLVTADGGGERAARRVWIAPGVGSLSVGGAL
jgi:hypothetical protein